MKKTFSISKAISFGWNTFISNWKFWVLAFLIFMVGSGTSGSANFSSLGNTLGNFGAKNSVTKYQNWEYSGDSDFEMPSELRNLQKNSPTDKLLNMKKVESDVLGMATSVSSGRNSSFFWVSALATVFAIITGVIVFIFVVIYGLISVIFTLGFTNLVLDAARNKQVYYKTILNQVSLNKAFKVFLAQLLVGLIVLGGLLLFIIPGIIFALKYVFVTYVMVDQEVPNVGEALKRSSQITKGVRFKLFGFSLLAILIWIAGSMVFGFGVIVSAIIVFLSTGYIYVKLADENTAEQVASQEAPTVPTPPTEPVKTEESLEALTAPSGL